MEGEEEDTAPINLQEPNPNEVAAYVSAKQQQLSALEAKVCCKNFQLCNIIIQYSHAVIVYPDLFGRFFCK